MTWMAAGSGHHTRPAFSVSPRPLSHTSPKYPRRGPQHGARQDSAAQHSLHSRPSCQGDRAAGFLGALRAHAASATDHLLRHLLCGGPTGPHPPPLQPPRRMPPAWSTPRPPGLHPCQLQLCCQGTSVWIASGPPWPTPASTSAVPPGQTLEMTVHRTVLSSTGQVAVPPA